MDELTFARRQPARRAPVVAYGRRLLGLVYGKSPVVDSGTHENVVHL